MFQKRHYEFLASYLAAQRGFMTDNAWQHMVGGMADRLARDNVRFNRDTFWRACGADNA